MSIKKLIAEDIGTIDITTLGLGIGMQNAKIEFRAKDDITLCGIEYLRAIMKEFDIEFKAHYKDGDEVSATSLIFEATGVARDLHKVWKISQNTLEYLSGIATYTKAMVKNAQKINPKVKIATTRKNFPMTKELSIDAIIAGGATPHRLGLYDSVLIFDQHLNFLLTKEELENAFYNLKTNFLEKKIVVEVDNYESAKYFASLGADVLQCEKMSTDELCKCVTLKKEFTHLIVSATGGVKLENVEIFAECGVDLIVTSAPYHAKPLDIKVKLFPWETL